MSEQVTPSSTAEPAAPTTRERIAERAYNAMSGTVLKTLAWLSEQTDTGDAFAEAIVQFAELAKVSYASASDDAKARALSFADDVLALVAPTLGEFDAARYVTKVTGKDYLEVKWRLVWLRREQPDAVITTELLTHPAELVAGFAVFRATVTLASGASATGTGSETLSDHSDYIEKAETKAVGRALAALGYGTQFTVERESVVDAPVEGTRGRQRPPAAARERDTSGAKPAAQRPPTSTTGKPAGDAAATTYVSEYQVKRIERLRIESGLSEAELNALIREMFSDRATLERLSVASATKLIAELEAGRRPLNEREAAELVAAGERAAATGAAQLPTPAAAPATTGALDDADDADVPFLPAGDAPNEADRRRDQLATLDDLVTRLGATPADLANVIYRRYQCSVDALDEGKRLDLIAHLTRRLATRKPAES